MVVQTETSFDDAPVSFGSRKPADAMKDRRRCSDTSEDGKSVRTDGNACYGDSRYEHSISNQFGKRGEQVDYNEIIGKLAGVKTGEELYFEGTGRLEVEVESDGKETVIRVGVGKDADAPEEIGQDGPVAWAGSIIAAYKGAFPDRDIVGFIEDMEQTRLISALIATCDALKKHEPEAIASILDILLYEDLDTECDPSRFNSLFALFVDRYSEYTEMTAFEAVEDLEEYGLVAFMAEECERLRKVPMDALVAVTVELLDYYECL